MTQIVSQPTRITDTTSSLIDHAYVLNRENVRLTCTIGFGARDHFLICLAYKKRYLDSCYHEQIHKYSQLRLIEPPVNRFHRLIGSKFHRIYRTELLFGLHYFRLIDFSA